MLADSFCTVADGHAREAHIFHTCHTLAAMSTRHFTVLGTGADRYHEQGSDEGAQEPGRLHAAGLGLTRTGRLGLPRDLQDLHALATLVQTTGPRSATLRDSELLDIATNCNTETARQLSWLITAMKAIAPQGPSCPPMHRLLDARHPMGHRVPVSAGRSTRWCHSLRRAVSSTIVGADACRVCPSSRHVLRETAR
jgi:hypothetical protein